MSAHRTRRIRRRRKRYLARARAFADGVHGFESEARRLRALRPVTFRALLDATMLDGAAHMRRHVVASLWGLP